MFQCNQVKPSRGLHFTVDGILASHPAALGSNPSIPKRFSEEILKLLRLIDGTAKSSDQRLDQTHLVLASGKLVLQKSFTFKSWSLQIFQSCQNINYWTQLKFTQMWPQCQRLNYWIKFAFIELHYLKIGPKKFTNRRRKPLLNFNTIMNIS